MAGYCRRCGYALAGLAEPRCPECGRTFDPADRRTLDRSPRRRVVRRLARLGVVLALLAATAAVPVVWAYLGWRAERAAERAAGDSLVFSRMRRIGPAWASRLLGRHAYWLDRDDEVHLGGDHGSPAWAQLGSLRWATVVMLHGRSATDEDLRGLSQLTRVRVLGLDHIGCSDAALAPLARMPNLENVYLDYLPRVTDAGLGRLAPVHRLRCLELQSLSNVDDDGGARLDPAGKPYLETVILDDVRVGDAGLTRFAAAPALLHVRFKSVPVGDAGLVALGNAGHVRSITVENCPVGDRGVQALYNSPDFFSLNLYAVPISDAALVGIGRAKRMWCLQVECDGITGATFDQLAGLNHLSNPWFRNCNLTDVGMSRLPSLPLLTEITLDARRLTAAGVQNLSRCPSLGDVWLVKMRPEERAAAADGLKRALPSLKVHFWDGD